MTVDIYNKNNRLLISNQDYRFNISRALTIAGSEDFYTLTFKSSEVLTLEAGAYIETGPSVLDRYYLIETYRPEDSESGYLYTVRFDHFSKLFKRIEFYFEDSQGLKQYSWTLNAKLETAAGLILDAVNREYPQFNILLGGVLPNTDLTDLEFDGMNAWDAALYIADAFNVEFWFVGNLMNFSRAILGESEPVELTHTENIEDAITAAYTQPVAQYIRPLGGKTNMPVSAQGAISYQGRLPMPQGEETIEIQGEVNGVTLNVVNDNIYPSTQGEITEVIYNEDAKNPIYLVKTNLGHSLASVRNNNGKAVIMRFTSGQLNGREFEVDDYDGQGTIEIFRTEKDGVFIPREFLAPSESDKFLLSNIVITDEAVAEASEALKMWAEGYAEELEKASPDITLVAIDGLSREYELGRMVKVTHPSIKGGSTTSRIVGVNCNMEEPHRIELTIQDTLRDSRLKALEKEVTHIQSDNGLAGGLEAVLRTSRQNKLNTEEVKSELDAVNNDNVFSLSERAMFRDNFETISGVLVVLPLDQTDEDAAAAIQFERSAVANILADADNKGTFVTTYRTDKGEADVDLYNSAITTLETTYEALRSYLSTHKLYHSQTVLTPGFSKEILVEVFTEYLNAEKEVLRIVSKGLKGDTGDGFLEIGVEKQTWTELEWEQLVKPPAAPVTFLSTVASLLRVGDLGFVSGEIYPNGTPPEDTAYLPNANGRVTLKITAIAGNNITCDIIDYDRYGLASIAANGNFVMGGVDTEVNLIGDDGKTFRPKELPDGSMTFEISDDTSTVQSSFVTDNKLNKSIVDINATVVNLLSNSESIFVDGGYRLYNNLIVGNKYTLVIESSTKESGVSDKYLVYTFANDEVTELAQFEVGDKRQSITFVADKTQLYIRASLIWDEALTIYDVLLCKGVASLSLSNELSDLDTRAQELKTTTETLTSDVSGLSASVDRLNKDGWLIITDTNRSQYVTTGVVHDNITVTGVDPRKAGKKFAINTSTLLHIILFDGCEPFICKKIGVSQGQIFCQNGARQFKQAGSSTVEGSVPLNSAYYYQFDLEEDVNSCNPNIEYFIKKILQPAQPCQ